MQELTDKSEELCDVLACYFPIAFTPPPDDPHGITREGLQASLQQTLACDPQFAPHVIPLLLEKLASSLRYAVLAGCMRSNPCQCARVPASEVKCVYSEPCAA